MESDAATCLTAMDDQGKHEPEGEQALLKLYMDLTGESEGSARSTFMYTSCEGDRMNSQDRVGQAQPAIGQGPTDRRPAGVLVAVFAAAWGLCASVAAAPSGAAPGTFITQPLSMAEVVDLALRQNASVLRAQKEVEAAQGIAIQTRAVAIPKLVATGNFNAQQPADIDVISIPKFPGLPVGGITFGNDKNWKSQIQLVQSLYEGGRMLSSLRAARLTREQSLLNYQTVVADTVLAVEIAYDDVLLAQEQIMVQEASVELLDHELSDTTRRFDAGTVPRFNVLRASVELANARPRLIHARNSSRIAKNTLANLLGFNVPKDTIEDLPLNLAGKLDAEPLDIKLGEAIATALGRRSELGALRKAQALRNEDIVSARSGYKPSVQAFAGYDAHNSLLSSDLGFEDHGWLTGVQLSWNIFDGLATQGRVKQAVARLDQARIQIEDTGRQIELEVRTAHSSFIEARDVLESQKKVVEEAEEALRLARSRYEAGTGTQLDVLSAQTALTEARTTEVQALHDYSVARARLERAVGMNVPAPVASGP